MILRINYIIQTLLMAIFLILLLYRVISGSNEAWLIVLYLQFVTGGIQLFVAFIMIFFRKTRGKKLYIYWLLVLFFFAVMSITVVFELDLLITCVLISVPWILALFFWYISYQAYKSSKT